MLNQTFAMSEQKTRRFGKLFNTIDFEFSDAPNVQTIEKFKNDIPIGTFHIGGKEFSLTIEECRQIAETMNQAETIFAQRYRMGFYGKR